MKNTKLSSKIFSVIMIMTLLFMPIAVFAAEEAVVCTNHIDKDGNGICDTENCNEEISTLDKVFTSLKYFLVGMVGIFIVTGIIILVIYALARFTNPEKKQQAGSQEK